MVNLFVRGIYSTAITKIFKDAGYNIVFPSPAIKERFKLDEKSGSGYSKDMIINDRYDKEGISVTVKKDIWDSIKSNFPLNNQKFPDLIQLSSRFPLNSIYKGIVIQSNKIKNYSIVRLIPEQGKEDEVQNNFSTTLGRVNRYLKIGTEDVFQVVFEDVGKNYAYLNQGYTVSGDLAVIMPANKRAFISKKIKDKEQRQKLQNVIEKVSTNEFGILLRTAAQFASEIEILREIQKLRERSIAIESLINQSKTKIGPVLSEFISFNFFFPNSVKILLDEIRSSVIPTMTMHHEIKAGAIPQGKHQLQVLELLESVMDGYNIKTFSEKSNKQFMTFYYNNLYEPKQYLDIFHYKINGRILNLRPGIIKKMERDRSQPNKLKIILRRKLSGQGQQSYDGLDLPIEEGDYAIGIYESGNMYYETLYYSQENHLKGRYFNINTPIVFRPDGIHYFDLEVDVIEPLNKPRAIIDTNLLDKTLELGIISKDLHTRAMEIAQKIKAGEIKSELDKIDNVKPGKEFEQETSEADETSSDEEGEQEDSFDEFDDEKARPDDE